MERTLTIFLNSWLTDPDRKPLILRGARQVGKTYLVRHFAKQCKKHLIEINFETHSHYEQYFSSNDPKQILLNLSTELTEDIIPEKCLLFLDEIQTAPHLIAKLRWFAEKMPELAVIVTGSLLEFVLAEHTFSMPVGRINYAHLEPLSFEEFLLAKEKQTLLTYLYQYDLSNLLPQPIHEQLMLLFNEYVIVGGMPAAVKSWISVNSINKIPQVQHDLLTSYRDDFSKYSGNIDVKKLDEVMLSVPKFLGQKFVYANIPDTASATVSKVLNLLNLARVCHRVNSTAANGIPLGAEINEKYFKEIFLDTGLANAILGVRLTQLIARNGIVMINKGAIAEQVVGQMLRTVEPPYIEPRLYCWHRHEHGSNAEVDYIIQHDNKVIPIEVKAGATGRLRSLHLFMRQKKFPVAVRINADLPSQTEVDVKDHQNESARYTLLSIPFYLVGQIHRFLDNFFSD